MDLYGRLNSGHMSKAGPLAGPVTRFFLQWLGQAGLQLEGGGGGRVDRAPRLAPPPPP